jgi:hypothetical protein
MLRTYSYQDPHGSKEKSEDSIPPAICTSTHCGLLWYQVSLRFPRAFGEKLRQNILSLRAINPFKNKYAQIYILVLQ